MQKSPEIMFVSRGHGQGHAMPDMAIADKLKEMFPVANITFVSYGSGASAYRRFGRDVIDIKLPDSPTLLSSITAFTALLRSCTPSLIISHEEFALLPIARAFQVPSIFITDFFLDPTTWQMQALEIPQLILFTAERGLYTEPPCLAGRITYVGRAVRDMAYGFCDRQRARRELGLSPDAVVVLCQGGAWTETRVPFATLLLTAWQGLAGGSNRLVWIAGRDHENITILSEHTPGVTVIEHELNLGRLMAASDVLITKSNRLTVYEAAAIGLPSISVTQFLNWPDDVAVTSVDSNLHVRLDTLSAATLETLLTKQIAAPRMPSKAQSDGVQVAARKIYEIACALREATGLS